jgi:hypothetical protein
VFAALTVVGLLLLASAAVLVIGDAGDLSARMPTQVPPRRFARYPLIAGIVLVVIGLLGLATS